MKQTCLILVLSCLVGKSMEFRYSEVFADGIECIADDGTRIPQGSSDVELPGRCVKCSCSSMSDIGLRMDCYGFGINAGTIGVPPWCSVETKADGCTPKIVCSEPPPTHV